MSDSPGWETIEAKLASIYGDPATKHWGTVMRYSAGGPDPLDGSVRTRLKDLRSRTGSM